MKVVINKCYGGFGLSKDCLEYLESCDVDIEKDIERNNPYLVKYVEEKDSSWASGPYAELKIVEIPDDVDWEIEDYDGMEWVSEKHRTWD